MNVVIETLFLRHPRFEYISPAICEAIFSGSGSPVIVLDPISHLLRPTGGVLGGVGAGDGRHLSWVGYPGALCYSFWMASDPGNPDSPYNLVSECVTPNSILLCNPGFYYITAVTAAGEGPMSSPIEVGGNGTSYYTIPLPKTPGTICYQLYKSFTIGGAIALYWSCFSGDEVHFQTCLENCYKMSVITIDGETPLSDPFCPPAMCDIQDPEIGQELCGPMLTWSQALCACGPCVETTPCDPGMSWYQPECICVANGGGGPHGMTLSALSQNDFCTDEAYSGSITVTNATSPVTWTITSGAVPTGMTFHGGGTNDPFVIIDGTGTDAGPFTFTVKCEDADGYWIDRTFTMNGAGFVTQTLPDGDTVTYYSQTLVGEGGTSYAWSVVAGALPTGLSLNGATGAITGAPTVDGVYNFTIKMEAS